MLLSWVNYGNIFLTSWDDTRWELMSNVGDFWMNIDGALDASENPGLVPYVESGNTDASWCEYTEEKALIIGILVDLDLIQVEI